MTDFTKGPWVVDALETAGHIKSLATPNGPTPTVAKYRIFSDYPGFKHKRDEESANARLIAAAPEMLEALEASLKWTVQLITSGDAGFWDVDEDENVIQMRKAIAKAKGEDK